MQIKKKHVVLFKKRCSAICTKITKTKLHLCYSTTNIIPVDSFVKDHYWNWVSVKITHESDIQKANH